jgi:hypothetical protein
MPPRRSPPLTTTAHIHQTAALLTGGATAVLSEDRAYRYELTRTWGTSGTHVTWIMLNPSTADALADDPTIRRCTAFTKAWGFDGLIVVNLFALRATDPKALHAAADPVGPDADHFIHAAIHPWSEVVVAWGAHPFAGQRAAEVMEIVTEKAGGASCLGVTKDGHPRHPLYLRADQELMPYGR